MESEVAESVTGKTGGNLADRIPGVADNFLEMAQSWLTSPAAWTQFALLLVAFVTAWYVTSRSALLLTRLLTQQGEQTNPTARLRRFALLFLPLMLPLLAYVFIGIGEFVTRSVFGSGAVIAFGKRVFLFLAARALVRDIVNDPFLKLLGKYMLVPAMALHTVGLLNFATDYLSETIIHLGNISFSAMSLPGLFYSGLGAGQMTKAQSISENSESCVLRPIRMCLMRRTHRIANCGDLGTTALILR